MTLAVDLSSEIEQELALLQELMIQVAQILELIYKTDNQNIRSGLISGLALHLHSFYTGAERIFYNIARDIDDKLPTGSNWHQELLRQINVEIPIFLSENSFPNAFCQIMNSQPDRLDQIATLLQETVQITRLNSLSIAANSTAIAANTAAITSTNQKIDGKKEPAWVDKVKEIMESTNV